MVVIDSTRPFRKMEALDLILAIVELNEAVATMKSSTKRLNAGMILAAGTCFRTGTANIVKALCGSQKKGMSWKSVFNLMLSLYRINQPVQQSD